MNTYTIEIRNSNNELMATMTTGNTIIAYDLWRRAVKTMEAINGHGHLSWDDTGEIIEDYGYNDEV